MVALVDDIKVSTVGKAIQAYQRLIAKTAPLNYNLPKKNLARICIGLFLDKLYWLKGGTNSSNSSSGCLASILTLLSIAASGYDCSPTVGPHTSGLHPSIQNFVHLFVLRMSIHSAWRFFTLSQFFKERTSLEARVNSSHVPVDVSKNIFLLMI